MSKLTPLMKNKLKEILYARSVAVVGASPEQLSVGFGTLYNIIKGSFKGSIYPVNPKYDTLLGLKCYKSLQEIKPPPELVIFVVNHHLAVKMLPETATLGVKGAVIVAGGFKELSSEEGKNLEKILIEESLKYEIPVIGPNTLGFANLTNDFNGIFWHLPISFRSKALLPVAIVSQSGGVGLTIAYSLKSLGVEPAMFIGTGNRSIVDFEDYISILMEDPHIKVLTLFLEGVEYPRNLYEALRRVDNGRHVVVYKAGKQEAVSRATTTHTGSLVGNYLLYKTMVEQVKGVEVHSSLDAAVASKALSMLSLPQGNRLCVVTFTAGPAIVAMDLLIEEGWNFPPISMECLRTVKSTIGEKTPVELQNPLDLTGPGFLPQTYTLVMDRILREDFDAFMFVWNYNPLIRLPLLEWNILAQKFTDKVIVFVVLASTQEGLPILKTMAEMGLCGYLTPEDGAKALNALLRKRQLLQGES